MLYIVACESKGYYTANGYAYRANDDRNWSSDITKAKQFRTLVSAQGLAVQLMKSETIHARTGEVVEFAKENYIDEPVFVMECTLTPVVRETWIGDWKAEEKCLTR